MLKDTEKEKEVEQTLPSDPPRKRWTCELAHKPCAGILVCLERTGRTWDHDPTIFCLPVELKE